MRVAEEPSYKAIRMKDVLVIGGSGFLGSHLIPMLLAGGHKVTVMDVVSPDNATKLAPVMKDLQEYVWQSSADVDSDDLEVGIRGTLRLHRYFDEVIYLAAQADVPLAITSPRWTVSVNVDGYLQVLKAFRKSSQFGNHEDNPRLLYISTENVYGHVPAERLPITEEEPFHPANAYAASKAAAELLTNNYAEQFDLNAVIFRSTTMFGERGRLKQAIPIFIRQALKNEPITIEGDGNQSRDFNYVGNMARAISDLVDRKEGYVTRGTFNMGSGREVSLKELAETIIALTGSESKIVNKPWRPGEQGIRLSVSIKKARKDLGYEPYVGLEEGLKRTIDWLSNLQ